MNIGKCSKKVIYPAIILNFAFSCIAYTSDLVDTFSDLFGGILGEANFTINQGEHERHFIPASEEANRILTPSLNSLIASEISSFPLTSTSVGVIFDFSQGVPVEMSDSLGPIFSENAETIGRGKFTFGLNNTYLGLDQFRGLDTEDIKFTFTHQQVAGTDQNVLGDDAQGNESDTIDVDMDLDVNANITAFYGSFGITDRLDFGIAVPLVFVEVEGNAAASINSFTFSRNGQAAHHFRNPDGTPGDPTNPVLNDVKSYEDDAFGLGDVTLRLKYRMRDGQGKVHWATLIDVRTPTGDEDDFLGSGEWNFRIVEVVSKQIEDTNIHVNLAYERREGKFENDEFEFAIGFDQKILEEVTFALDILGNFDLDSDAPNLSTGTATIVEQTPLDSDFDGIRDNPPSISTSSRVVDLSNVPEDDKDNEFDISVGIHWSPSERYSFLANIIVPLNDAGLRSQIAPTFGINVYF